MVREDVYEVARNFGGGRKQRAFDLAWREGRPVIEREDPDFGPSEQERDSVLAALSRSYRCRGGYQKGAVMVEEVFMSDPRTVEGFRQALYRLPEPFLLGRGR